MAKPGTGANITTWTVCTMVCTWNMRSLGTTSGRRRKRRRKGPAKPSAIKRNWKANLNVNVAIDSKGIQSDEDISLLRDLVRFPVDSKIQHYTMEQERKLLKLTNTDLNIFSLSNKDRIEDLLELVKFTRTSALFCIDSTTENALV